MFFSLQKVIDLIQANIRHHEMNEHSYRQRLKSGSRTTTNLSKDDLLDLILDYLGLEVDLQDHVPKAKLVEKSKVAEKGDEI